MLVTSTQACCRLSCYSKNQNDRKGTIPIRKASYISSLDPVSDSTGISMFHSHQPRAHGQLLNNKCPQPGHTCAPWVFAASAVEFHTQLCVWFQRTTSLYLDNRLPQFRAILHHMDIRISFSDHGSPKVSLKTTLFSSASCSG